MHFYVLSVFILFHIFCTIFREETEFMAPFVTSPNCVRSSIYLLCTIVIALQVYLTGFFKSDIPLINFN